MLNISLCFGVLVTHSCRSSYPSNMRFPNKTNTSHIPAVLNRLLTLCQVLGARPIQLSTRFNKPRACVFFIISIIHVIWTIFVLSMITISMYEMYTNYMDQQISIINQILNVSEFALNLFNCFIIALGSNYQRQWPDIYFRYIAEIDAKLQFPAHESNAQLSRFLRNVLIVSMLFIVPVMIIMFYYHNSDYYGLILKYISYIVTNLILTMGLVQFLVMLSIVKIRYKRLASCLAGLSWVRTCDQISSTAESSQVKWFIAINPIDRTFTIPNAIKQRLENLRHCYVDLNILERNISQSFGLLIASFITSKFFVVTAELYMYYTLTQVNVGALNLAYAAVWLISHFTTIFSVLYLSGEVVQEVHCVVHNFRIFLIVNFSFRKYRKQTSLGCFINCDFMDVNTKQI